MLRKTFLGILVVVSVLGVATYVQYEIWLADTIERLESESTVVRTAHGDIEYALWGDAGPAILFLHGTPGGYDQAGRMGPIARAGGYRVVAPSRPGYLRTPLDVGRTPAEQADAFAALLSALDIEQVAVVGASGGGPSALQFALRHPDRCWAHVQLMGVSRARLPSEGGRRDADRSRPCDAEPLMVRLRTTNFAGWVLGRLARMSPESSLEGLVPDPANRKRILDDPEKLAGFLALVNSATALMERRQAGQRNDSLQFDDLAVPDLATIRCPTLVLHGTADRNVPIAMGELVANGVPGAEMIRFEGADHFMVLSHAEEVMRALFGFADRHSGLPPDRPREAPFDR